MGSSWGIRALLAALRANEKALKEARFQLFVAKQEVASLEVELRGLQLAMNRYRDRSVDV